MNMNLTSTPKLLIISLHVNSNFSNFFYMMSSADDPLLPLFYCQIFQLISLHQLIVQLPFLQHPSLHKKWNLPLRTSSVNVTKSTGNCEFGHIYWNIFWWKISFSVQCVSSTTFYPTVSSTSRWRHVNHKKYEQRSWKLYYRALKIVTEWKLRWDKSSTTIFTKS